ncbi:MAG: cysteine dioxygenase family protein, partial [Gemmataceae bacterium]
MTPKLAALLAALDDLPDRPPLARLTGLLERSGIGCDDVADLIRFSDNGYAKNTVKATPSYHAWVLCWKNGQRSPIHDHRGSCCAVRVLRGTLTQTFFEFAPNGHVKATGSKDFPVGSVIA